MDGWKKTRLIQIKRISVSLIKNQIYNSQVTLYLVIKWKLISENKEKTRNVPTKVRTIRESLFLLFFKHIARISSLSIIKSRKEIKFITGPKATQLSGLTNDTFVYIENNQEFTRYLSKVFSSKVIISAEIINIVNTHCCKYKCLCLFPDCWGRDSPIWFLVIPPAP